MNNECEYKAELFACRREFQVLQEENERLEEKLSTAIEFHDVHYQAGRELREEEFQQLQTELDAAKSLRKMAIAQIRRLQSELDDTEERHNL